METTESMIELVEIKTENDDDEDFFVNTEVIPAYPKVQNNWPCKLSGCTSVFNSRDDLDQHRQMHFECVPCEKNFKTRTELRHHRDAACCKFWVFLLLFYFLIN